MRTIMLIVSCFFVIAVSAAEASWQGIGIVNGDRFWNPKQDYTFMGYITHDGGGSGEIRAIMWGHEEYGRFYLENLDYSGLSVPVYNTWVLTAYGETLGLDSIGEAIEIQFGNDIDYVGGTLIETPEDFYLGFRARTAESEDSLSWYGWMHVSVDEDWKMTLLGSGINLDGGAVLVGGPIPTPEPTSALLLMLGVALLGLRRNYRG